MRKNIFRQYLYKFTRMPYSGIFLFLFLAGFLGGIVFANVAWGIRESSIASLNLLTAGSWLTSEGNPKEYLRYLANLRLKIPVFLMVLGLTSCGMVAVYLVLLWYGFLGGLLCSAALLQLGVKGMLQLFTSLALPLICYVPITAVLLNQTFFMSEKSSRKEIDNPGEYGKYILICVGVVLALGAAVLVECYVNPAVLRFVGGMS